ncbi:MAG: 50S ribosomal protein L37ae [Candidatus Nanoarchaeia archaeon]
MSKTKKVKSAGRFGARYGLRIRKKIIEIEQIQRRKHKCPFCLKYALKRISCGIWQCKYCNVKFAGKAYEPGLESLKISEGGSNV